MLLHDLADAVVVATLAFMAMGALANHLARARKRPFQRHFRKVSGIAGPPIDIVPADSVDACADVALDRRLEAFVYTHRLRQCALYPHDGYLIESRRSSPGYAAVRK
jgi:hypothetical protein